MSNNLEGADPFSLQKYATPTKSVGFELSNTKEGAVFHSSYNHYNQLFFLLSGSVVVNSSEALDKLVQGGEFFFMPPSTEMLCKALKNSSFLIFYFDQFYNVCDRVYFRDLWTICSTKEYIYQSYAMRQPLMDFSRELSANIDTKLDTPEYRFLKYEEYLYLFRLLYSKEEMAAIFHPIIGKSIDFRRFVMEHYLSVKNIEDLVELSGVKRKTFDRQFNEEFGMAPYRWVLKQKAKHIYYAISETNEQMQELMKRYGFTIAPHFTRFCKDYFNATPLELKKRFQIAKLNNSY
jgi:AraC-like DNA-binding protein/quercetin dioxygenase-like cupin family protein